MPKSPLHHSLGNALYAHCPKAYVRLYALFKRLTDREAIELLRREIQPGEVVVDIGGNVGFYSRLMADATGDFGQVHVFEPDPDNFALLHAAVANLDNVVLNQAAAADADGTVRLYRSASLNVDHRTYDSGESREYVEVPAVCLDTYFTKLPRLDFIKIDVQGYDCHAIQGLRNTILRSPGVGIFSEFWPYGLVRAGVQPQDYLDLLRGLGFRLTILGPVQDGFDRYRDDFHFYTNLFGRR